MFHHTLYDINSYMYMYLLLSALSGKQKKPKPQPTNPLETKQTNKKPQTYLSFSTTLKTIK